MSTHWTDGAEGLEQPIVSTVTHSENEVVFDLTGLPDRPGVAATIFEAVAAEGVNVDTILQDVVHGAATVSFSVPLHEVEAARRALGTAHDALGSFDVVEISDLAAAMTGGLGLAPSASLADHGPGIFEPVHGSAPDIAGKGVANPAGMLRSTALLLEHGLGLASEAAALEASVERALASTPTPDLGGTATTDDFADAVLTDLAA